MWNGKKKNERLEVCEKRAVKIMQVCRVGGIGQKWLVGNNFFLFLKVLLKVCDVLIG